MKVLYMSTKCLMIYMDICVRVCVYVCTGQIFLYFILFSTNITMILPKKFP